MTTHLAISASARADPEVRALVKRLEQGDVAARDELHAIFVRDVADPEVRALLDRSRKITDANAPIELYANFLSRLQRLKTDHLFPKEIAGDTFARAQVEWSALETELRVAAERLWRDSFLSYPSNAEARRALRPGRWGVRRRARESAKLHRLRLLCRQAHLLWLLWLEVTFYQTRMTSNYKFREEFGSALETNKALLREIAGKATQFRRELNAWDRELHAGIGSWYFRTQVVHAQRLKSLKKTFGASGVKDGELGWIKDASDVGELLRVEYYNTLRRESARTPRTWLRAAWLAIFRVTSGYGAKPLRFAGTTIAAILAFTALFFVSDLYASPGCKAYRVPANPPDQVVSFVRHLYVAVTSLTSLGADPTPCGVGAHTLLAAASLVGYFLLATLAALFIQQLIETD